MMKAYVLSASLILSGCASATTNYEYQQSDVDDGYERKVVTHVTDTSDPVVTTKVIEDIIVAGVIGAFLAVYVLTK